MLERLYKTFTSLRLTVVLLALGLILVFWGTLAQVNLGLYKAQNDFFRSFFVFWVPPGASFRLPIFPGGYLVGGFLLINLFAAHLRYYRPGKRKWGIVLIHLGVVLLLLGQLLTDLLSTESMMHIRNGGTKNYSEASMDFELAIIDTTDAATDQVVAIPSHRLQKRKDIRHPDLPFTGRVKTYFENSALREKPADGFIELKVTAGMGASPGTGIWWRELPQATAMNERSEPSGIVELLTPEKSLGTYLVSSMLQRPQEFTYNQRTYQMALRLIRHYKPFSLHLVEFKHDRYAGTEIPKNFSSRVRLQQPEKGEDREVLIYMNNPLRYAGETFYQASFDADDQGTVLQVVHNPSWLTPYFSCVLVTMGMVLQFTTHLVRFASKRKIA